ncbi:MAG: glycoside hydrolase domain-containing protein, partial [Trebonia sp.]
MGRRGRVAGLAVAAALAAGQVLLAGASAASASPVSSSIASAARPVADPAALVDPFVGTGSGGDVVGQVDTFPGASVPFGMIQWSPDTPSRPDGGGYDYADSQITGFSLTHLSGPGCAVGGDFPILPLTGAIPADPDNAAESFGHSSEAAHPGYYAVTAGGVRTQLAVTDRTGVAQFTYPATTQAQLLVKASGSASGGADATFATDGDQEISGSVTSGHFCGQPDSYTVYFAARFDRPFTASGTWGATGNTGSAGSTVDGGYLTFDTTRDQHIGMQVAVSYVSVKNAEGNLAAQARTWNVGAVAAQATAAWNRQLSTIQIAGGTTAQQQEFYTALYHASLDPTLFSDANGQYTGFDDKVHTVAKGHEQYANYSGWDIYRSEVPLLATIDPKIAADMATSLVNDAAQMGALPK